MSVRLCLTVSVNTVRIFRKRFIKIDNLLIIFMKKKKFWNDVYSQEFVFIYTDSIDKVWGKYAINWNGAGGCCYKPDKIYIILSPIATTDILVHECDHAVSELWRIRGIKKIEGVDECYAYMLAWVFRKCQKIIKKHNRK